MISMRARIEYICTQHTVRVTTPYKKIVKKCKNKHLCIDRRDDIIYNESSISRTRWQKFYFEGRKTMYKSPKAELLYPETEAVLSDVLGASQEQNDNDFNITDLL